MYERLARIYDTIFPFNPHVVRLIEEQLPGPGCALLDIGCGTGRYTGSLAAGHRAVGIDTDGRSISIARRDHPGARFIAADLFAFEPETPFDLVFCIGNVVSHIDRERFPAFIGRVRAMLADGGAWLFHIINWDSLLGRDEYDFPVIEREGVSFRRGYRNMSRERVDFTTILTEEDGRETEGRVVLHPHTAAEIELAHDGFSRQALYGGYRKEPFVQGCASRVYIYRKTSP